MTQLTIHLPPSLADAVRQQAAAQRKSPDTLVIEWVAAHITPLESALATAVTPAQALLAYSGRLRWPKDALVYQKELRDEWE